MCTVSYIPISKEVFIFTSNRDETPRRSATGIVKEEQNEKTLLFPRDPLAKGTWIAISDKNQLVCILNGAFRKHKHRPPYRLSRGIMALEFFKYNNADDFVKNFDFIGIEPFTMIIYDQSKLYELRWNEQLTHYKEIDATQYHIWASCTLYPEEWQEKRRQWFSEWQNKNSEFNLETVLDFHKNAGEGNPEFDVVMNRYNRVRTTSITSVIKNDKCMLLRFEDILKVAVENEKLSLSLSDHSLL